VSTHASISQIWSDVTHSKSVSNGSKCPPTAPKDDKKALGALETINRTRLKEKARASHENHPCPNFLREKAQRRRREVLPTLKSRDPSCKSGSLP
jgi:phage terminase small subunit